MGLPGTPGGLTPSFLQDLLLESPSLAGTAIESITWTDIGEGFGLDGTTARLDLVHDGEGPRQLVAKLCSAAKGEREIRFYRDLGPTFPAPLAGFHGGRWDDERAVLLLESIDVGLPGDALLGAPDESVLRIARAEAAFHARFWNETGLESMDWLPAFEDPSERVRKALAAAEAEFVSRWGAAVPEPALRAFSALASGAPTVARRFPGPRTLIHTDLHLDNIVFRAGGEPVLLDWPEARRGPCALDVSRLLVELATREQRPRLQEAIFKAHIAGLTAGGVSGYSQDDLRRDVAATLVHVLGWAVLWALRDEERDRHPRVLALKENIVPAAAEALASLGGSEG